MRKIIKGLKAFNSSNINYQSLGAFVKKLEVSNIDYLSHLPAISDPDNYRRNILLLEPLECVLLHWPPNVESAVHFHQGFWGYVLVLEGTCDNVEYLHKGNKIEEGRTIRAQKNGIIAEPDGTIHKITNPSKTETLVTCHFYYPALDTLDGLALYNLETGTIGILNEKAKTASFLEPRENFKEFNENAFEVNNLAKPKKKKPHYIFPVIPKPSAKKIKGMIRGYYGEQAKRYDQFDLQQKARRLYLDRIDMLIAHELSEKSELHNFLAIACGTGRRAINIRELTGRNYNIEGVDICGEMCKEARKRDMQARHGDWLEVDFKKGTFEVITFLYSFGHIPTNEGRMSTLQKIYQKLAPGGILFFDLFNRKDQNEWGPNAVAIYEELELAEFGYDKGDVFYKRGNGNEIAFLHYFDEEQIRMLLEDVGFEVDYIKHIKYRLQEGETLSPDEEGVLFIKAVKPMT